MKKIIIALYLLAVVFQSVAFAEPYKSSRVPPENILLKVVVAKWGDKRQRIIGKFKDSDNYYKVYHIYPNGVIRFRSLIKLDTNIWIYDDGHIVQK